ncbi:hypothetical protein F4818DRAFT_455907 [Hypoxylon cercidicola]|nr:hypothetical protein F4818DRAFT_455907 [Hypoxylon cercidicola]
MPIKENFTFEADEYRAEVKTYSLQTLRQQETAMARKCLTSSFSTGAGVGTAPFTGGLTLAIACYKGRSTWVAHKKHGILQAELVRRDAEPRDVGFKDMAIGWGVGAEVGSFVEGVTHTDAMGAHLPDGANKSTGLTADPATAAQGAGGQVEQLVAYLAGAGGDSKDAAAAVAVADRTAYHVGMVQAQIIEEQFGSEGAEALLMALTSPPIQPSPDCERARQDTRLICTLCREFIKKDSVYWHCCPCKNDDFDLCLDCRKKGKTCWNKHHAMTKLVCQK